MTFSRNQTSSRVFQGFTIAGSMAEYISIGAVKFFMLKIKKGRRLACLE